MIEKKLWNMFFNTGEIKYYLMYRKLVEKKVDGFGISESSRNNSG